MVKEKTIEQEKAEIQKSLRDLEKRMFLLKLRDSWIATCDEAGGGNNISEAFFKGMTMKELSDIACPNHIELIFRHNTNEIMEKA